MAEQYLVPRSAIKLASGSWLERSTLLALLLGAIFILTVLAGCRTQESDAANNASALTPDLTLTLFSGEKFPFSNLRGKPVLLNFWASWCPSCRSEAPALEQAWQTYKNKGIVFLGIDLQDKKGEAKAFLKEFGIDYPNGADTDNEIATRYSVSGIPTTIFIDRDGNIVRHWVGPLDDKQLATFIEETLR